MSENFNVGDLLAKTTAVHVPPFSIISSGENLTSINDWYDLDSLFQDDFFPKEVDFTNMFAFDESQYNVDMDATKKYSALAIDVTSEDKTKVIMIPPVVPRSRFPADNVPTPQTISTSASRTAREVIPETPRRKVTTKLTKGAKGKVGDKRELDVEEGDEDLTEDQRLERRDRNREHAKRSRIRKRVLLDTLEDQLTVLRAQNVLLRRVVADQLPGELAARVLLDCTTEESTLLKDGYEMLGGSEEGDRGGGASLKPSPLTVSIAAGVVQQQQQSSTGKGRTDPDSSNTSSGRKVLMEPDYRLISSLITSQQNFVLSDPSLPDNPIVYASDGFCRLSGYRRQDVLGRNCRFLQGPGTDQAALNVIRQGLAEGRDISVCLLNYRANGTPFWNQFFLGALKDAQGNVVNYVGVQCEVNTLPISEIKDRIKKMPLPED